MKFSLQISGKKSRCCETRVQSGKLGKSPIIPIICPTIPNLDLSEYEEYVSLFFALMRSNYQNIYRY